MKKAALIFSIITAFVYLGTTKFQDMRKIEDLTGQKFGKLTILSIFYVPDKYRTKRAMVSCKCDCGNHSSHGYFKVKTGHTKSCGCIDVITKHGYYKHKLYGVWEAVVGRCTNSNSSGYKDYGGRGIKICDEWRNNPSAFIQWGFENGWMEGLTLERENVNGNYEPSNCRWATHAEQSRNTRRNRKYTYMGESLILKDWAKKLNIALGCLNKRKLLGWPTDKMLGLQPIKGRNQFSKDSQNPQIGVNKYDKQLRFGPVGNTG